MASSFLPVIPDESGEVRLRSPGAKLTAVSTSCWALRASLVLTKRSDDLFLRIKNDAVGSRELAKREVR